MQYTIGIGEMKVTGNHEDVLITYSLGSCIGLSLYDPGVGVGGLIHCMLPLSKLDPEKAKQFPGRFTDTGVAALLSGMYEQGACRKNLIAKVAGGAMLLDAKNLFKIGERNYTVLRKMLWKNNIMIAAEQVGGIIPRTMVLDLRTGKTFVKSNGRSQEL